MVLPVWPPLSYFVYIRYSYPLITDGILLY
nr:MAG TPA: hypothetical protein [Caudoviricetes sp.]